MNCTAEDSRRPTVVDAPRCRARAGFTLLEMMVAVVILTVGMLGLVSTSAVITRQVGGGAAQTVASQVIANRLEKFRSLGCSQISSGSETTRGISERWTTGAKVNRVLFVVDTITYSVAGSSRPKTLAFSIAVPCQQ